MYIRKDLNTDESGICPFNLEETGYSFSFNLMELNEKVCEFVGSCHNSKLFWTSFCLVVILFILFTVHWFAY